MQQTLYNLKKENEEDTPHVMQCNVDDEMVCFFLFVQKRELKEDRTKRRKKNVCE